MTSAQHATFTIARNLDFPLAMVFNAWADAKAKSRWFATPVECTDIIREQNFRIGGRDRFKATWPNGRITDFSAEYWDIVPNHAHRLRL